MSLYEAAKKFRDAFTYNPGHSDLDNEQPITITVTLGDWRKLNYALSAQDGDMRQSTGEQNYGSTGGTR